MKKFVVKNKKSDTTFYVDALEPSKEARVMRRPMKSEGVKDADDKPELTKEEIESLKELAELVPELKKLLEAKPEEEEEETSDEGEEEVAEEETLEGDSDDDVIIEEQEEEQLGDEEEEEEEDDEEECGVSSCDSKASVGSIEARNAGDSVLAHEEEVAMAFDSRYKKSLSK